jgi:hypothetical protein
MATLVGVGCTFTNPNEAWLKLRIQANTISIKGKLILFIWVERVLI